MSLRSFTLHDLIERNAAQRGARTAFVADGERVSHAEFAARGARLAAGLRAAGVGSGDRVAVLAHNGLAFVDLLAAAARLGRSSFRSTGDCRPRRWRMCWRTPRRSCSSPRRSSTRCWPRPIWARCNA